MISEVIRFRGNDMALVFGKNGEQIPEFQGQYEKVRLKILTWAPREAKFYHSTWSDSLGRLVKVEVPRKEW